MERLLGPALMLILCAVLECLLPPGGGKKAFRVLCGVVVFASAAAAFRGFDVSELDLDLPEISSLSQESDARANRALLLAGETGSRRAAQDALQGAGIAFDDVQTLCAAEGEGVSVRSVTVTGVENGQAQRANRTLAALFPGASISVFEKS